MSVKFDTATETTTYGLQDDFEIHAAAMSSGGIAYAVFNDKDLGELQSQVGGPEWNRICAFDEGPF